MTKDSSDPPGRELSLDACLELLGNRQRRVIVGYFLDAETDYAPLDAVVSAIVDDEARRTGDRPGHDSVSSVLFHVHLPNFADAGILDYDPRNKEIRYHGNQRLEDVFRKIHEIEWVPARP